VVGFQLCMCYGIYFCPSSVSDVSAASTRPNHARTHERQTTDRSQIFADVDIAGSKVPRSFKVASVTNKVRNEKKEKK
jgi:hypothetical protein